MERSFPIRRSRIFWAILVRRDGEDDLEFFQEGGGELERAVRRVSSPTHDILLLGLITVPCQGLFNTDGVLLLIWERRVCLFDDPRDELSDPFLLRGISLGDCNDVIHVDVNVLKASRRYCW